MNWRHAVAVVIATALVWALAMSIHPLWLSILVVVFALPFSWLLLLFFVDWSLGRLEPGASGVEVSEMSSVPPEAVQHLAEAFRQSVQQATQRAQDPSQDAPQDLWQGGLYMTMFRERVCIDLDGTLAQYDGWHGDHSEIGPPIVGALEATRRLAEQYELVVLTAREDTAPVEEWLRKHDFPPMRVTNVKPGAKWYIDDRAVEFNGSWAQTMAELRSGYPVWWEDPR